MSADQASGAGLSRSPESPSDTSPRTGSQAADSSARPPAEDGQPAAAAAGTVPEPFEIRKSSYPNGENPRLRYLKPYWWPYRTFVKQRWIGRQLLEVISTEFRDRSVDYYRHALECGVTKLNGEKAGPESVLRDGDRLDNTVHRHEPPITNQEILVLHIDQEREFVVISKPGSIPVHATGRYYKHTILELMESDYGLKTYSVNRLDRLTSGLMLLATSGKAASKLGLEFAEGKVKKEYVARVMGKFPEEEITVDKPLLTVDRQMGLVIVCPEGKESKTIFKRMHYDAERDQTVVHCRPQTGRTHQIRVHLQYLGHPIANDPLYGLKSVWGERLGRGGVELITSQTSQAEYQAAVLAARQVTSDKSAGPSGTGKFRPMPNDEDRMNGAEAPPDEETLQIKAARLDLKDREVDNIDVTSPILLSQQAKEVIARLRRMKDEQEDWVKWKEVVFNAKAATDAIAERNDVERVSDKMRAAAAKKDKKPKHDKKARAQRQTSTPAVGAASSESEPSVADSPSRLEKVSGEAEQESDPSTADAPIADITGSAPQQAVSEPAAASASLPDDPATEAAEPLPEFADGLPVDVGLEDLSGSLHVAAQAERSAAREAYAASGAEEKRTPRIRKKREKVPLPDPLPDDTTSPLARPDHIPEGFCTQCFVPVADDPDPETMFIYLHALRYETPSLGRWETPLPRWAGENWKGDWRGWVGDDDRELGPGSSSAQT